MELSLHIVLQTPPAGVHFGLQKGSGVNMKRCRFSGLQERICILFTIGIKGERITTVSQNFAVPLCRIFT